MRPTVRSLRSRFASTVAALALLGASACIEGEAVIEEQACEAAPDCYQGDPCLIDRCEEGRCVADPIDDSLPGGGDHDGDGRCDAGDADDDDDGRDDILDACPKSPVDAQMDYDGDGCFDGEDDDDDGDGIPDVDDACRTSVPLDGRFVSSPLNDADRDGCADGVDNQDADGDGVPDGSDLCRFDGGGWVSNEETDYDGDGCRDTLDPDDDDDGRPDGLDRCPTGERGWFSTPETDFDRDGCRDQSEDDDDDDDGVPDADDECDQTPIDRVMGAPRDDLDGDGCDDLLEDSDDDNDGVPDVLDHCTGLEEPGASDLDGDGCIAEDDDDDNDGVPDDRDRCISAAVTNWQSFAATDNDGDGCRDSDEDDDDDDDGVLDIDDACPLEGAVDDTDGDGCDDSIDEDDDGDGVPDVDDACPLTVADAETPDYDGDGCVDPEDDDDDDDGVPDARDACRGTPGRLATPAVDRDRDGCIDGREDLDDDNDGRPDVDDRCPVGEVGWSSVDLAEDHDQDGCRDGTEDEDDDDDGVPDELDCDRLDARRAPGLAEVCDGADNDCDGDTDEGTRQVYFEDRDGDGFGDPERRSTRCPGEPGYVLDGTDCDDDDRARNPRDGCPQPRGTRDGRWSGPLTIEVSAPDGRSDDCEGVIEVDVSAERAPQVEGGFTCRFVGDFADGNVVEGSLFDGWLSGDELAAEGFVLGAVEGVFVVLFDGPEHGVGFLGGELPEPLRGFGVAFEAHFELDRGGVQ